MSSRETEEAGPGSPNVVVVRDAHEAQRFVKLFNLLSRFSGGLKHRIHTLPPHDISPYSGLYSNRGLMLQRLNWLFRASFRGVSRP